MKKYKIGITFNLEHKNKDVWSNGVHQNLVFLYQLFNALDCVEDVVFLSWGPENITDPREWNILSDLDLKFYQIDHSNIQYPLEARSNYVLEDILHKVLHYRHSSIHSPIEC